MSPPHTDTTASPPLSHDVGTPSGQACYSPTRATPDTDTPRDPVEHSYDKDRPWTPAVKRVAEPVMLHITGAYQRQLADSWRYGENRAISGQKRSWELLTDKRMCRPSDASALSSPSPRYRLHQRSQCQRAFRQKVFVASNGSARSLSQTFGQ